MSDASDVDISFKFVSESKIMFDDEKSVDVVLDYCDRKDINVVMIDSFRRIFVEMKMNQ